MATALGFMGCNNATGPLAEAAARSTDAHHDHAIIHSLILLNVPELLQRKLQSKNPRVQRAALIALDQINDSPLRSDDVSPLLDSADAELSRAALWVMTHHPDWTGGVAEYLDTKVLLDPDWTEAETATVREGLTVFAGSKAVQQLMVRWLDGRPLLTVANLEARRPFLLSVVARCELKALPAAWTQTLSQVIGNSKRAEATRLAAIGVVQTRGLTSLDAPLRKLAGNPNASPTLRLAAMGVAAPRMKMVTADTTEFLQNQIGLKSTATARASAARVIGRLPWTPVQLQSLATETLPQADGFTLPLLLPAFASSQDAAVGLSLVNALTQAPQGVLRAAQVTQVLEKFPAVVHAAAKPLLAELARANAANEKRLEELVPLLSGGDVGRGREVYFGQKAVCSTCHTIGEDGGNLGPDLTSIGAIRSGRDILEAIVFPSATQVPGHEAFLVQGSSKALIGLVVRETATAITLRTAPGVELRLVRRDISSITPAPVSLMPAGLDRILARDEFRDLLAFLQSQNGEQWLQPSKLGKKDLRVRDSGIRE